MENENSNDASSPDLKRYFEGSTGYFQNHLDYETVSNINGELKSALTEANLQIEDQDANMREKNREIIFYLKEIEKLQSENEKLRFMRYGGEGGLRLKAYKLKLINRKLKDRLKEVLGGKQTTGRPNKQRNPGPSSPAEDYDVIHFGEG